MIVCFWYGGLFFIKNGVVGIKDVFLVWFVVIVVVLVIIDGCCLVVCKLVVVEFLWFVVVFGGMVFEVG